MIYALFRYGATLKKRLLALSSQRVVILHPEDMISEILRDLVPNVIRPFP